MPKYLPLSASRQELLPDSCRSCAWWQTAGITRVDPQTAATIRERWMLALESGWGSPGIIQVAEGTPGSTADKTNAAVIHYAPASTIPRLHDLILAHLPTGAIVLFCLRLDGPEDGRRARRLLHETLRQLKHLHVTEVYGFAVSEGGAPHTNRCEFFSRRFLAANGFHELSTCDDISLMRADLRGLLSILAPLETALRRLLHNHPTPSPAAWSSRETP